MTELMEDEWIRDVSAVLGVWMLATVVACGVLLAYGFGTGAF